MTTKKYQLRPTGKPRRKKSTIPTIDGATDSMASHSPKRFILNSRRLRERLEQKDEPQARAEPESSHIEHADSPIEARLPSMTQQATPPLSPRATATVTLSRPKHLPMFQGPDLSDAEVAKLKKLPTLNCDTCHIGLECRMYNPGDACAYQANLRALPIRNRDQLLTSLRVIVEKNQERLHRAYMSEEVVSGGVLDPQVTRLSEQVLTQLQTMADLDTEHVQLQVTESTSPGESPKQGILAQLFGSPTQAPSQPPHALGEPVYPATVPPTTQPIDTEGKDIHPHTQPTHATVDLPLAHTPTVTTTG